MYIQTIKQKIFFLILVIILIITAFFFGKSFGSEDSAKEPVIKEVFPEGFIDVDTFETLQIGDEIFKSTYVLSHIEENKTFSDGSLGDIQTFTVKDLIPNPTMQGTIGHLVEADRYFFKPDQMPPLPIIYRQNEFGTNFSYPSEGFLLEYHSGQTLYNYWQGLNSENGQVHIQSFEVIGGVIHNVKVTAIK